MMKAGRQAYVVCIEGSATVNAATKLEAQDAGELVGPGVFRVENVQEPCRFLLLEMKQA